MSHVGVWSSIWSDVCELYVSVLCVSAVGDHQEQCGFGFGVVSRRIVVFPHSGVPGLSCRSSLVWVFRRSFAVVRLVQVRGSWWHRVGVFCEGV